ncbi:MAG: DeoR/GlpR transcriptional regulator [Pseudomonadota bacterium]|nr:DeoR/GlpR transcriptional regulator [Pseudomonadota bacterium]
MPPRLALLRNLALEKTSADARGESILLPTPMRQTLLVEATRKRGFLFVAQMAVEIGVSEMTIRRDLIELERAGQLIRTHGGAAALGGAAGEAIDDEEPSFEARARRNADAKRRIARAAAELAQPGQAIALDVGTTTHALAQILAERAALNVFTASLRTATLLASYDHDPHLPGGQARGEEPSVSGPAARASFERRRFDIAFLGVSGLTEDGLYDYSLDDSEMKRLYLRRATTKVLLCDGSKFRRAARARIAGFLGIDLMICDVAPPDDIACALKAAGTQIRIAP